MRLQWDLDGMREYETGVDHGILFPRTADGSAYENGVVWNGLTSIDESPSGAEANDIYADNIKYLSLMSAEDFGGTINAYTYPEEFAECNGQKVPASGVYVGQQNRKAFGMYYRTIKGNDTLGNDYGNIHHLVYNAKAQPSDSSYQTVNDSPEAIEMSWEFKTTTTKVSAKIDGKEVKPTAIVKVDTTKLTTPAQKAMLENFESVLYGGPETGSGNAYIATTDSAPVTGKTYYTFGVTTTYKETEDTTPVTGKQYYTKSGDVYTAVTVTEFDPQVTYYEIDTQTYAFNSFSGSAFTDGTVYFEAVTASTLPSPDQVINMFKAAAA